MKPLLIIKTGNTVQSVPQSRGDFENWIATALGITDRQIIVSHVISGEQLPAPAEISGVVITGSAAMVTDCLDWSEYTAQWLRELPALAIPVLGICYGHQLLAHAYGGEVSFHPAGREIGTTEVQLTGNASKDPLFKNLPEIFEVNVSHMQTVSILPDDAVVLAHNAFEAHHAVRFHDCIWGVQFHPEFERDVMLSYLMERSEKLQEEGYNLEQLRSSVKDTPCARALLRNFAGYLVSIAAVSPFPTQ